MENNPEVSLQGKTQPIQIKIQDSGMATERMEKIIDQISIQPGLTMMIHSNLNSSRASALIAQP